MTTHRGTIALLTTLALAAVARADDPEPTAANPGPQTVGDEANAPEAPKVGDEAAAFSLQSIGGETVALQDLTGDGPVVLTVLRGFPGYQCPICSRQVRELINNNQKFAEAGAQVAMVYPGPSDQLRARAEEFLGGQALPENFTLLLDPGYEFTNAYHLRWDAPRETSYPSTFVIGPDSVVRYAKVSTTHGDRAPIGEVLEAVSSIK